MADEEKSGNAYYSPSTTAAILFAVLFGFTTAGHIFQGIRYKKVVSNYSYTTNSSSPEDESCSL